MRDEKEEHFLLYVKPSDTAGPMVHYGIQIRGPKVVVVRELQPLSTKLGVPQRSKSIYCFCTLIIV